MRSQNTKYKIISVFYIRFINPPYSRLPNTSADPGLPSVMSVLLTDAPAKPVATRSA